MSSYVFPDLAGLDITVERETIDKTSINEVDSGKEYRISWWSTPRYRYNLSFTVLRENVNAPSPWNAYSEIAILLKFFDDHYGAFDSFLYNDPYDGVQRRVRFEKDTLPVRQVWDGVWQCEFSLISVK